MTPLHVLTRIIGDLPIKRDWLDPDLEKMARSIIAHREGRDAYPAGARVRAMVLDCVKACEGMQDPEAEIKALRDDIAYQAAQIERLKKDSEFGARSWELIKSAGISGIAVIGAADNNDDLALEIGIKVLIKQRDALLSALKDIGLDCPCDNDGRGCCCEDIAREAIALCEKGGEG